MLTFGEWSWTDGSKWDYQKWGDIPMTGDAVAMQADRQFLWKDLNKREKFGFICQKQGIS